jgi:Ca-activated chloride channel family protein
MTRLGPTAVLVVVLAAVALAAHQDASGPAVQEARPAFRAGAEAVAVDVAVRQRGRPVTGLRPEDFDVLDNGVPQAIVDLSYERLPIDVTVAFDISASVTPTLLNQLHFAVQQLRQDLGRTDRLRLLTFNHRVRRAVDVTDAPKAIDAAFERIRTGGSSAIFDSIAVALSTAAAADRRHLVVVFSDGQDTISVNTPSVLLDVVRRTTPAVYVVLPIPVPTPGSAFALFRPATDNGREMFLDIAAESGGVVAAMGARESLPGAFRRAFTEFRSSYVLHFVPTGVEQSGVHQLTVRVKRDNVDVRARREYVRR